MSCLKPYFAWLLAILLLNVLPCCGQRNNLKIILTDSLLPTNVIASYGGFDKGGNTSIAFDAVDAYKWSGATPFKADSWGYFTKEGREVPYIKRDRDLGQTFLYEGLSPRVLKTITVSTGYGSNVVRPMMYGKPVSIQIFEVNGTAVLNDNGSGGLIEAFHGFPHNRPGDSISPSRDDYYSGETFTSLAVFTGGKFPSKKDFGFSENAVIAPGDSLLKGRLLQFFLPPGRPLILQPGKTYAFLIMIDNMGLDCGFTLANHYTGYYKGGHAIRRDGNGVFPPVAAMPLKHFKDPKNKKAYRSAHFPSDFEQRTRIVPGTNGYPDVDTWRDLFFAVEVE